MIDYGYSAVLAGELAKIAQDLATVETEHELSVQMVRLTSTAYANYGVQLLSDGVVVLSLDVTRSFLDLEGESSDFNGLTRINPYMGSPAYTLLLGALAKVWSCSRKSMDAFSCSIKGTPGIILGQGTTCPMFIPKGSAK